MLAVCVRKFSAEVFLSGEKGCEGIATVIARQHNVNYGIGKWLNVADESGTAFIENENKRLPGCGKKADELFLIGREIQVIDIARSLSIGILTNTGDNDIGRGSGPDC